MKRRQKRSSGVIGQWTPYVQGANSGTPGLSFQIRVYDPTRRRWKTLPSGGSIQVRQAGRPQT